MNPQLGLNRNVPCVFNLSSLGCMYGVRPSVRRRCFRRLFLRTSACMNIAGTCRRVDKDRASWRGSRGRKACKSIKTLEPWHGLFSDSLADAALEWRKDRHMKNLISTLSETQSGQRPGVAWRKKVSRPLAVG